jgi:maltose alpha-D-glucosyltransferase/alpha-amylase
VIGGTGLIFHDNHPQERLFGAAGAVRMPDQPWYMHAVFYELSVRSFRDSDGDGHGDLRGLIEKLDYLNTLGVDCLWLMPIYCSPLRDDGYDIADYCSIAPAFGNLEDLQDLLAAAHGRGIRIIMDLVLNHTSDEHPWFKAARSDRKSPYRDYYVWSDNDRKFADARVIFLDTETSNWTLDPKSGQYYWHRFYSSQPDLNFDNPRVQAEMLDVVRFWLGLGIDGFRIDAVPYLIEREGTNCENLRETHDFLKRIRRLVDLEYPGRILLCEANQWPEDLRPYFGKSDEFHMGFHFPLMPRIFMALKKHCMDDVRAVLERTPVLPEGCQWCTFLRNHDELTLEMVTDSERRWMWSEYAPLQTMRLNLGVRRRLAPLLDNDQRLIELANSMLFTLPGVPIIYYGDEIGMGDNIELPDRIGLRTPMQWDDSPESGFTDGAPIIPLVVGEFGPASVNVLSQQARPDSLFNSLRRMIRVRKAHPEFSLGSLEWIDVGNPSLAAYMRCLEGRRSLVLANLSSADMEASIPPSFAGPYTDMLAGIPVDLGNAMALRPFAYVWLQAAPQPG